VSASSPAVGREHFPRTTRGAELPVREGRPRGWWEPLFVVTTWLILAARLFRLVSRDAVNIFFNDQWDFGDATLFQKHPLWEMFRWQYGPHRLGLGPLVAKLVEPHFRWNSRGEAFMATAIVTAAAIGALYLKTRVWGPLRFFDIAIPLIFFTPAQYESLWLTPDFAHGPLPLLLLVLYCLALTCERPGVRYALILILNFAAIYTGFGLFIGFVTPLWLLLDYYSRREAHRRTTGVAVALAVSIASLGSFFVGYRLDPDAPCFSLEPHSPASYLNFAALLLVHFFGLRKYRPITSALGFILLAAMVFVLVNLGRRFRSAKSYATRDLVPAVLAGYCLIFCAATAYGRSCFGTYVAFSSRYTEYIALGMLSLYFYSLAARPAWARKWLPCLLVVSLLAGAAPVLPGDRRAMQYYHDGKSNWRSCYLKTEDIHGCDMAAQFAIYTMGERTGLKEKLEYLKRTKQNLYSDIDNEKEEGH